MHKNKKMKTILVTGGAGYLGSMLCTKLISLNYNVIVIDILKYSKDSLKHLLFNENFKLIVGDVSNEKLIKENVKKADFIIPLAAIVGAPLCDKNKKLAKKINYESILIILKYINKNQKIIYPTTNSGYGIGEKDKYCDEKSPLNPVSLYGVTKVEAEKAILSHKNSICLRLATVFGYSYRMRTDLIVNNFTYEAVKKNKLILFEPNFRRNFVHVKDVVDAFIFCIKYNYKVKSGVYNLGLSTANITKLMLAKKIKKYVKKLEIKIINNKKDPDKRDYYVSNKKIEKAGFKASISLDSGIKEMINIYNLDDKNYINNY